MIQYDLQSGVSLSQFVKEVRPELFHQKLKSISAESFLQISSEDKRSVKNVAKRALIAAKAIIEKNDATYLNEGGVRDPRVYMDSQD